MLANGYLIIDPRENGSLSPFYLSYFLGMEPSSPLKHLKTTNNGRKNE